MLSQLGLPNYNFSKMRWELRQRKLKKQYIMEDYKCWIILNTFFPDFLEYTNNYILYLFSRNP